MMTSEKLNFHSIIITASYVIQMTGIELQPLLFKSSGILHADFAYGYNIMVIKQPNYY